MCEPVTATTAALSVASTGLNYMGGVKTAKANNARYLQNADNVREATALNYQSAQLETLQAGEAAGREKIELAKDGLRSRAAAQVGAGESGVTGLSVDALVRDVYGQEASASDAIDQQSEFRDQQTPNDLANMRITGRSQIQQVRRGQNPSVLGALVQLGTTGVQAYTGMKSGQP